MGIRIIKKANIGIKPLTIKQQKVVSLVSGNVGKIGSKADVLRQAGYSPSVANNPDHVFNSLSLKSALEATIIKMQTISNKALIALENKPFEKESVYNLAMISSTMIKNLELLEGRPTDRTVYELSNEEKARLDKLLVMNSKCSNYGH
ncbi:MAG: hypothetical protein WA101_00305 [Minisyncoccia bacterium]